MLEIFAHVRPEEHEYDRRRVVITNVRHLLLLQDLSHHPGFSSLSLRKIFNVLDQCLVYNFSSVVQALGCCESSNPSEGRFFTRFFHGV